MTARKKASGRNIPEAERHTVALKLRLSPEVAELLRSTAETEGRSVSDVVAAAVQNRYRPGELPAKRRKKARKPALS